LENIDVTDKIAGHMSYRTFMPLILDQLGFSVSADHFDEPEEPDFKGDRVVVKDDGKTQEKGWFGRRKNSATPPQKVSRPPSASSFTPYRRKSQVPEMNVNDDDLPPREELTKRTVPPESPPPQAEKGKETQATPDGNEDAKDPTPTIPLHAGFDFEAIKDVLRETKDTEGGKSNFSLNPVPEHMIPPASPIPRSGSAPPYTYTHPTLSRSQLSQGFARDEADNVSGALTPAFSRSLSLAGTPSTGKNNEFTSFDAPDSEVPAKSPLSSDSASLSFGGYDGSIWQAPSNEVYHQSRAAASTPPLPPLGNGRGAGSYGYLSSSPAIDPFDNQPSLSFGGSGGTIDYVPSPPIVRSSNNEAEPWSSSLTRGKKPINGFNSNPWA